MKAQASQEPQFSGLSKDFESFDILWFDLQSKVRQLIQDLCQPMVDKIHEHEDNIHRITKHANEEAKKVFHLENIVYDKADQLDVFEKIYKRIADVVAERREVEIEIKANNAKILHHFDLFEFKMTNHEKELRGVIEMSKLINDQNSELKDIMRQQNESFTASLKEMQAHIVNEHKDLRQHILELHNFSDKMFDNHGTMRIEI